jgi:hypothetical protein
LLQAFYTVRSERQLMEQLNYNLLFRWFVGLSTDDPVWDAFAQLSASGFFLACAVFAPPPHRKPFGMLVDPLRDIRLCIHDALC